MSAQQENFKIFKRFIKISKFVPEIEWKIHQPLIEKINKLKKEKNAIILAHNYQTPEIYHGAADIAADLLALAAKPPKHQQKNNYVWGALYGRNSKINEPRKKVFLPDMRLGAHYLHRLLELM